MLLVGFLIEHCNPNYVFDIFQEAFRCLSPGGIFIVETPNGRSLWTRTQFNLDPTHRSPIHPQYLDFIGKYHGFGVRLDYFESPRGDMIPKLSQSTPESPLKHELAKFENWVYAPMDLTAWNTKPLIAQTIKSQNPI